MNLPAARAQNSKYRSDERIYRNIVGIPPQSRSVMEPHNQGSLGDTMGGQEGGRWYEVGTFESRGDGANVGLAGEANQRRRRVQRDKKVVWERSGVCACATVSACAIVW